MYKYNLLRTDRISNSFRLEIRHPFINKKLIEYILSIHPKIKRENVYSQKSLPITKYIIRKAFEKNVYNEEVMPENILWRQQSCLSNSLTNFELRLNIFFESYISDDIFSKFIYNLNKTQFHINI